MKKILCIVFLLSIYSCSKEEDDTPKLSCTTFFDVSDMYVYPIRPGMEEWKKLQSRVEMVQACQIPEKTLKSISTEGLMETVLCYPLLSDIYAFDWLQQGFNGLKNENNGFAELYSRTDVFSAIMQRYEIMSLDYENVYPPYNLDNCEGTLTSFALQYIEFIMFQDEFLHKLNDEESGKLFKLVYDKFLLKIEHDFSGATQNTSSAILGKIMYNKSYQPFVDVCNDVAFMKSFIEYVPVFKPLDLYPRDVILGHAKEYLKSL